MKGKLGVSLLVAFVVPALAQQATKRTAVPKPDPFARTAARKYEALKQWTEAEQQYMKLGEGATAAVQAEAIAGVERVREARDKEKVSKAIAAAELLIRHKQPSQAEAVLLDLIKSEPQAAQNDKVADLLRRSRPELFNERWTERWDRLSGYITRVLVPVGVLAVLGMLVASVLRVRRYAQVLPFSASDDASAQMLASLLQSVRAEMLELANSPVVPPVLAPNIPSVLAVTAIGVNALPAIPDVELAGAQLPVSQVAQWFGRPKVRVSGGWFVGTGTGHVFAEIETRQWLGYAVSARPVAPLPSAAGAARDVALKTFAYDVYRKAANAYES